MSPINSPAIPDTPVIAPRAIRPIMPTYNSWDSTRYSQRNNPLDAVVLDRFDSTPTVEAQTARRPSIRVDESPTPLYRLGWRSILQIIGVGVASCTLGIAASNLYLRLHHKVECDIPH